MTIPEAIARTASKIPKARKKSLGVRHEDKRVAILRTSAQLFATHGYEATSLDMIAEQLGMHKATLYHYIKSKDEVLYQCLVKSFENLDLVIEKLHDRSVPVFDRLRHFAVSLSHAQNNDFGRCLVLVGARPLESMTSSGIRAFQRRLDSAVRELTTEGIASGELKPCNPGLLSAMLFGTLNWVPQWYKADGKLSIDEVVDSFMNMLANGIATRSQPVR
ncbi:MAG: TetR/AcrR family transcriptional regulator [Burkholderiaceae bacterium]|nr:TetR/AcrR family transcriptional regulator [Burkholderiaceae bacterium]